MQSVEELVRAGTATGFSGRMELRARGQDERAGALHRMHQRAASGVGSTDGEGYHLLGLPRRRSQAPAGDDGGIPLQAPYVHTGASAGTGAA